MVSEQTGTIRIKKASLLKALRKNKEKHIKQYAKAIEGFRKKALSLLEAEVKKIKKGKLGMQVYLAAPVKRVEWYDKKINMYSAEIGEVITLSHNEYDHYVQDLSADAVATSTSNAFYAKFSKSK